MHASVLQHVNPQAGAAWKCGNMPACRFLDVSLCICFFACGLEIECADFGSDFDLWLNNGHRIASLEKLCAGHGHGGKLTLACKRAAATKTKLSLAACLD